MFATISAGPDQRCVGYFPQACSETRTWRASSRCGLPLSRPDWRDYARPRRRGGWQPSCFPSAAGVAHNPLKSWIASLLEWRRRRSDGPTRLPQQVSRLLLLFALLVLTLIAARYYLVPQTFGELGHYRASAIDDELTPEIKYASRAVCESCHWDVLEVHSEARHQSVACEACHGPGAAHVDAPDEVKPFIPTERAFCPRCHQYDPSRPTGFPQIDPIAHNPLTACVTCHDPHAPEPPNLPATCGACHGEIARLKAASHHATVPCIQCHDTTDEHRDTPRTSLPTKPTTRELCGGCHAPDADSSPNIPRIQLDAHGERYVCWQCHYPHYPETR